MNEQQQPLGRCRGLKRIQDNSPHGVLITQLLSEAEPIEICELTSYNFKTTIHNIHPQLRKLENFCCEFRY